MADSLDGTMLEKGLIVLHTEQWNRTARVYDVARTDIEQGELPEVRRFIVSEAQMNDASSWEQVAQAMYDQSKGVT